MARKTAATAELKIVVPIPATDDECDQRIEAFGMTQRVLDALQVDLNERVAKLKADFETAAGHHTAYQSALGEAIEAYCKANRKRLTDDGKVKSYAFGNGTVGWRAAPPSVRLKKIDQIIAWVLEQPGRSFRKFLRVTHEVSKEAMLANPEKAAEIPGVTIKSAGEKFYVTPIGLELEQPK